MPRGTLTYICEVTSMKKKIIAAIAAFAMAFALCSCGRSADDSEPAAAQPSAVTTAATAAETAAVTTAPQSEPTTTTTAESETTTPENTTTAEVTTTSDSKTTTTAEKKTTTAKQTTAAPKNTTAAKQTAAPKKTTTTPKKTTAKPATTTKRVWTRELTEEEFWELDWQEQDDYMNWLLSQPPKVEFHTAEEVQKIREELVNEEIRLINVERAKVGLQPLQTDPQLQKMADQRAYEETVSNYDAHIRPDGSLCYTIWNEYTTELTYAGENTGSAGFLSVGSKRNAEINVAGYMNSEGHKANILNPNAKYVAIGTYYVVLKTYDTLSEQYYDDEYIKTVELFAA